MDPARNSHWHAGSRGSKIETAFGDGIPLQENPLRLHETLLVEYVQAATYRSCYRTSAVFVQPRYVKLLNTQRTHARMERPTSCTKAYSLRPPRGYLVFVRR